MSRRSRTLSSMLALIGALALVASPALGKEGAEAKLDSAVPRDAEPGSTVDVGWSVFSVSGVERQPMYGSPVYVRLVSRDRTTSTEAMGTESPSGSGHYTASVEVPAGAIGEVVIGLVGEACDANGCRRSDLIFPIVGPTMAFGVSSAASATPATPPAGTPIGTQPLPLIAIGAAFALAGALALIVGRRRALGTDPAGQ